MPGVRGGEDGIVSEQEPEARAVCEHFYASYCYRGMSIRLCMTCGEPDWDDLAEQLGGRADPEPLILPGDETPWTPGQLAAFQAHFDAAMANPGPLRVLPSDHWKARAEAAEAKLAEVRAVLLEGGQDDGTVRRRALAMTGSDEEAPESPGVTLIAAERARQVAVEGWTAEHDAEHAGDDLARAAACYATPPDRRKIGTRLVDGYGDRGDRYGPFPEGWPWHPDWWKPGDRLRELVKAGALIAAEIDRLIDNG